MMLRPILPVLALTSVFAACSSDDGGGESFVGSGGTSSIAAIGGVAGQSGIATVVGGVGGQSVIATMVGGASAGGVSGQSTSTATSPNTGCPIWPREQFFPAVGPFFYGPGPGPCSSTVDGKTSTYTYDASGKPTRVTVADNSSYTTYTYELELLVLATTTLLSGSEFALSYHYGTNSAGVSYVSGDYSTHTEYELDSLGYPVTGGWSSSDSSAVETYAYEYESCRISRRVAHMADGTVDASSTAQYVYDAEQRLTSITSAMSTTTFDYSCW